jgi:poly(3-hydroxybutyrate) depolymerase
MSPGSNPLNIYDDFIVVVPQMPCLPGEGIRSFSDNWIDYADTVRQVVETVRKEYRGDHQHIYLTGFSLGGNGVLDIAQAQPNFWAALWPVDPTRPYGNSPQSPIWLWYGKDTLQQNQTTVGNLSLQSTPANGIPAGDSLCTNTGLPHVPTATSAYAADGVYDWLRAKMV